MNNLSIGIYEKALPESPDWFLKFDAAKEAGYNFVEIAIDESEQRLSRLEKSVDEKLNLRHAALKSGINLNSIVLSAHRRYPMGSADAETRKRARHILEQAVNFACDTGFRMIQLAGYYVFYEEHSADNYNLFYDNLSHAIDYASKHGVMLALENVDGEDILSIEKIMHFVTMFNSPFLSAYPDIGNLAGNGLNVSSELLKAQGNLVGIHLKDVNPKVFRRVDFGDGIVDFQEAFRTLATMNYTGNFLIEMWNDNSPDAMQIVGNARLWIIEQMRSSGLIA
jgi:L-ribulose-5-phosphate 3-epimerase